MTHTRRTWLGRAAGVVGGLALGAGVQALEKQPGIKVGSCVIGLPEAKRAGLEGVEVGVGRPAERLELADPERRKRLKEQMQETGLVIPSLMMGLLNECPLARDARAPGWLEQSIEAARDLGAKVILVAFFHNGDLLQDGRVKEDDLAAAVKRLKAAAPRAKDAGVILGVENYLPAKENVRLLDLVGHDAVRLYYDVGNSTHKGYDVPAEIRLLGDRICQFHFKDGPNYLGEGQVKFPAVGEAIRAIGYRGWVVLETSNLSKDAVADARRNAAFTRKLLKA